MAGRTLRGLGTGVVMLLALQVGLGLIVARTYLSARNTLFNNGNWVATKTTLEEGVMGAHSYVFTPQALAGGRLQLAAWHGYQEVLLREEVDPAAVELDFLLKPDAWLAVELQRTAAGYRGLRFSRHPDFPPMVFEASPEGEFLSKREVRKLGRARAGRRTLRVEVGPKRADALLDGQRVARLDGELAGPQRIGFRAGSQRAWVDDVVVVERDGGRFHDGFDRPRQWLPAHVLGIVAPPLAAALLLLLLARRPGADPRRLLFVFLTASGVLVVVAAIGWGFLSWRKGFYPDQGERLRREETYWRGELEESIFRRIDEEHPPRPEPGVHRIIFVGSSQTRGAGARTREETWVRRTEGLLERATGGRFECINTGVSAYRLADMARVFDERWAALAPHTVVLDAGNNDQGGSPRQFESTLVEMVRRAHGIGARVVLVLEPNSTEHERPALARLHRVMREVARREGALAIDMHAKLAGRRDEGFLWWDWVHLTSFGQRLFAEELVEELLEQGVVPRGGAGG
ncbi:MAG: SGNH/GDSL hydrolase family protein [Thermoanaerobaculia bacterium]|nr:SGNH/GDSL hydrolase family protein [Thermoanaerobaculia bacterium]